MYNYFELAVKELFVYKTPKPIIEYIKMEKIKSIIKNPPYSSL